MHPLWRNIGIQIPLFMKMLGEFQNFLLTGVKLGFKGVSFFLQLNPSFLQVFDKGRHVRMKDSVWDVSFNNRLYEHEPVPT